MSARTVARTASALRPSYLHASSRAGFLAVLSLVLQFLPATQPAAFAQEATAGQASSLVASPFVQDTPVVWRRTVLWLPAGKWGADPARAAGSSSRCRSGIVVSPAGSVERLCSRGLSRPVMAVALSDWSYAPASAAPAASRMTAPRSQLGPPLRTVEVASSPQALDLSRSTQLGSVVLSLTDSQMALYDPSGLLLSVRPVSAGKTATPTPTGVFAVQSRSRRSVALSDRRIQLEYMVRFNGSIGFHGIPYLASPSGRAPLVTPLGVANVSLGCVRLEDADAAWLYEHLSDGALVTVLP